MESHIELCGILLREGGKPSSDKYPSFEQHGKYKLFEGGEMAGNNS